MTSPNTPPAVAEQPEPSSFRSTLPWRVTFAALAAAMAVVGALALRLEWEDAIVSTGFFFVPGFLWLFAAFRFPGADPATRWRQFGGLGFALYLFSFVAVLGLIALTPFNEGLSEFSGSMTELGQLALALLLLLLTYRAGLLVGNNVFQSQEPIPVKSRRISVLTRITGWLALLLKPAPALAIGVLCVGASLRLAVGPGWGDTGWAVLLGQGTWVTAEYGTGTAWPLAKTIVDLVGRATYAAALLLASLSLFLVAPMGRKAVSPRWKSRLATGGLAIALVALTDLFFGWVAYLHSGLSEGTVNERLAFCFASALWIAIPVLFLIPRSLCSRAVKERLLWLFLPICFADIHSVWYLLGLEMPGFVCYLLGALLCSLGMAQIAWGARPAEGATASQAPATS